MRSFSVINKLMSIAALGVALMIGASGAKAQGRDWSRQQDQQAINLQQKAERQRQQAEQDRLRQERQRGQMTQVRSDRYRVNRNGSWYNTDQRGADLLRQAVQAGYQQGFAAGRSDRNMRRGMNWGGSNIYRSGSMGWNSGVDRGQYQYYFQQGFQRGYQDGYNSRTQFGSNNGGGLNILGSILGSILNIQRF